ncbi:uncharacterized protein BcabD6B2_20740 [Babesia caballi]|uniref:Uncharacterized protein n=1 Tax=Babesia caballi TaxID=5871 RepID=A0AAV4LVP4_BABCB|nr:hypothetical protein BcabD6B2_20740 [Babesia caballi]
MNRACHSQIRVPVGRHFGHIWHRQRQTFQAPPKVDSAFKKEPRFRILPELDVWNVPVRRCIISAFGRGIPRGLRSRGWEPGWCSSPSAWFCTKAQPKHAKWASKGRITPRECSGAPGVRVLLRSRIGVLIHPLGVASVAAGGVVTDKVHFHRVVLRDGPVDDDVVVLRSARVVDEFLAPANPRLDVVGSRLQALHRLQRHAPHAKAHRRHRRVREERENRGDRVGGNHAAMPSAGAAAILRRQQRLAPGTPLRRSLLVADGGRGRVVPCEAQYPPQDRRPHRGHVMETQHVVPPEHLAVRGDLEHVQHLLLQGVHLLLGKNIQGHRLQPELAVRQQVKEAAEKVLGVVHARGQELRRQEKSGTHHEHEQLLPQHALVIVAARRRNGAAQLVVDLAVPAARAQLRGDEAAPDEVHQFRAQQVEGRRRVQVRLNPLLVFEPEKARLRAGEFAGQGDRQLVDLLHREEGQIHEPLQPLDQPL